MNSSFIIENENAEKKRNNCRIIKPMSNFINNINHRETKTCIDCRNITTRSRKNPNTKRYKLIEEYKRLRKELPSCVDCGDDETDHKEFDHVDSKQKICNVGWCRTIELMRAEVAKCVSRCRKCHCKRTQEQFPIDVSKQRLSKQEIEQLLSMKNC